MWRKTVALAALLLGLMMAPAPAPAAAATNAWTRVDKVQVNSLGGITVTGSHSCGNLYTKLRNGGLTVTDDPDGGPTRVITARSTDVVVILSNPDNYDVWQPASRTHMVHVQHGSSRMTPCFTTNPNFYSEFVMPCTAKGPCRWKTDRFGYFGTRALYDYSPDGKFVAGPMAVTMLDGGYDVTVYRGGAQVAHGWHSNEVYGSQIISAVA